MSIKPKILIIGIGSKILGDSGIGPRLVEDLKHDLSDRDFDFTTVFKGGWEMLEIYEGYDRVIIIDSIKTGQYECGQVHFMNENTYKETRNLSSSHDLDFKETLHFGREVGMMVPEKIQVIAVEINDDLVIEDRLSTGLDKCYDRVYQTVLEHIRVRPGIAQEKVLQKKGK